MQTAPMLAGPPVRVTLHMHLTLIPAFQQWVLWLCYIPMLWHGPQVVVYRAWLRLLAIF
jgi:hypothetical protein